MTPVAPLPRDLKFFLIATLALALALAAARQLPALVFAPADLHFDIARNLLHSGTFGRTPGGHTLVRGPAFVLWLLPWTALGGGQPLAGVLACVAAQGLGALAIARLARRFARDAAAQQDQLAQLAGLAWLLHPALAYFDLHVESVAFEGLTVALCILAGVRWREDPTWNRVLVLGVTVGIATLSRQTLAVFCGVGSAGLVVSGGGAWSRRLGRVLAVAAVSLLVIAPWTARNYAITGQFYLVQSSLPGVFLTGNAHAFATGSAFVPSRQAPLSPLDIRAWGERTHGSYWASFEPDGDAHFAPLVRPMWTDARLLLRKLAVLGPRLWYAGTTPAHTTWLLALALPLYLLGLLGFLRLQPGSGPQHWLAPLLLAWLAATVVHGLVYSWHRYGLPLLPPLLPFAAHGVLTLRQKFAKQEG